MCPSMPQRKHSRFPSPAVPGRRGKGSVVKSGLRCGPYMMSHAARSSLYFARPSGVFAYVSSAVWARLASSAGSGEGVRRGDGVVGVWGTFLGLNMELGRRVFSLVRNGLGVLGLKRVWGVCGDKRFVTGIWGGISRPRVVGVARVGVLKVGMFGAVRLVL